MTKTIPVLCRTATDFFSSLQELSFQFLVSAAANIYTAWVKLGCMTLGSARRSGGSEASCQQPRSLCFIEWSTGVLEA